MILFSPAIRKLVLNSVAVLAVFFSAFPAASAAGEEGVVLLATTTSTENSGLLEYLVPQWEKETGFI